MPDRLAKLAQPSSSRVLEKGLDCLIALAAGPPELGVTELARRLGTSKTSVHRLLKSLQGRGFVLSNPATRKYRLGPAILQLSGALLGQLDLRTLALPHLTRLRDATGETASLAVLQAGRRVHLAQVESREDLRFTLDVGTALPALVGASGKALVAFLARPTIDTLIAECGLPSLAPGSITDPEEYHRQLAAVRAAGFAVSVSERYVDVVSVASPIFDHRGDVVGAVNITGPATRCTPRRAQALGAVVKAAAIDLSLEMGWRPAHGTRESQTG
jgi:DNA-binding IclR family transcriptional regulator